MVIAQLMNFGHEVTGHLNSGREAATRILRRVVALEVEQGRLHGGAEATIQHAKVEFDSQRASLNQLTQSAHAEIVGLKDDLHKTQLAAQDQLDRHQAQLLHTQGCVENELVSHRSAITTLADQVKAEIEALREGARQELGALRQEVAGQGAAVAGITDPWLAARAAEQPSGKGTGAQPGQPLSLIHI